MNTNSVDKGLFQDIPDILNAPNQTSTTRWHTLFYIALVCVVVWSLGVLFGRDYFIFELLPFFTGLYVIVVGVLKAAYYHQRYHNYLAAWREIVVFTVPPVLFVIIVNLVARAPNLPFSTWFWGVVAIGGWYLLTRNFPIWRMEMPHGKVFLLQHETDMDEQFEVPARPRPNIDDSVIDALLKYELRPDQINVFLDRGAPNYLQDEMRCSMLDVIYKKYDTLTDQYAIQKPTFKFDPDDVPFTERMLKTHLEQVGNGLKNRVDVDSQRALGQVEQLRQRLTEGLKWVDELVIQARDPRRRSVPLTWIYTYDRWWMLWDKTKFVKVEVEINDLETKDNLPFGIKITFMCTFEPDKLRNPGIRSLLRNFKTIADTENFVRGSAHDGTVREVRKFFADYTSKAALEDGTRLFREYMDSPEFKNKFQSMQIYIQGWSIVCVPILQGKVIENAYKLLEEDYEIQKLRNMLELGNLNEHQQSEVVMRLIMLQNLPKSARISSKSIASRGSARRPATPQLPQQQAPPQLPPTTPPPPAQSQPKRKKARRPRFANDIDEDIIDLKPDPNDSDSYSV